MLRSQDEMWSDVCHMSNPCSIGIKNSLPAKQHNLYFTNRTYKRRIQIRGKDTTKEDRLQNQFTSNLIVFLIKNDDMYKRYFKSDIQCV